MPHLREDSLTVPVLIWSHGPFLPFQTGKLCHRPQPNQEVSCIMNRLTLIYHTHTLLCITHTRTHVYMHTCMHSHMHTCTHTHTHTIIHHTHAHTYTCTHACMTHTYAHTHILTDITHTHTLIYITHTHTQGYLVHWCRAACCAAGPRSERGCLAQ